MPRVGAWGHHNIVPSRILDLSARNFHIPPKFRIIQKSGCPVLALGWVWKGFLAQDRWPKARGTSRAREIGRPHQGQGAWNLGLCPALECDLELNTKGRYAVMAMVDLAKYGSADSLPLSIVARRQALPMAYLEQIFAQLRKADLVVSVRGRSGGYRLARPAAEISIADVMGAVEEATQMTRCSAAETGCLGEKRCLTHGLWDALGTHIEDFLTRVTLHDVVAGLPNGEAEALRSVSVGTGEEVRKS